MHPNTPPYLSVLSCISILEVSFHFLMFIKLSPFEFIGSLELSLALTT